MSDVQKLSGQCSVHILKCPCLIRQKINEIYYDFYEISRHVFPLTQLKKHVKGGVPYGYFPTRDMDSDMYA